MDELIDNNSKSKKSNNFSKIILILVTSMIFSGIIMTLIGLSGLPLSIPGIGFLIAHLAARIVTKKLNRTILTLGISTIIFLILFIVFLIEIVDFLNYGALLVCFISFLLWFLIELIILKLIKLKSGKTKTDRI